jgi:hypothetical protein
MQNNQTSNYQDLLKTIAIIAVILDHLGLYFFPKYQILRAVGRFAMPIFCFFVGYNYKGPRHILAILGAILTLMLWGSFNILSLNMLLVMYIGQWGLYFMDKCDRNAKSNIWIKIIILIALIPITSEYLEYGSLALAFILVGRCYKLKLRSLALMSTITIASILFTLQPDYFHFSTMNQIIVASLMMLEGYLMHSMNHLSATGINLRMISRNSLYIYFADVFFSIIGLVVMQLYR